MPWFSATPHPATGVSQHEIPALEPSARNRLLLEFSYLQGLDILTTVVFLLKGLTQSNFLLTTALSLFSSPLAGLIAFRAGMLVLGLYCWRSGRVRTLTRLNVAFAFLVAWNLGVLIVAATR